MNMEGDEISEAASENQQLAENGVLVRSLQVALGGPVEARSEEPPGTIPEAASESRSEPKVTKKRGRPKVFEKLRNDPGYPVGLGVTDGKTDRAKQEAEYAWIASHSLAKYCERHPELLWLTGTATREDGTVRVCNPPQCLGNDSLTGVRKITWKVGILAELGRAITRDPDGEQKALNWVVELANMRPRPTVKQAVAWIRNQRLPRDRTGNVEDALGAILNAIDRYGERHPDTPPGVFIEALEYALAVFSDVDEDESDADTTR